MPRRLFAWGLSAACTRVSLSSMVQYIDPIEIEQDLFSSLYHAKKKIEIGGTSLQQNLVDYI